MSAELLDPETERLAREIARTTGKTVDVVIREAIAEKASASGVYVGYVGYVGKPAPLWRDDLIARLKAISDRCAALPILDARTADEIIGYDERGVPR